jgi:hypothetical protein
LAGALILSFAGCAVAIPFVGGEPEAQIGDTVRALLLSDVAQDPVEGRLEAVSSHQFVLRSVEDPTTTRTFARGDILRLELAVPLWRTRVPTCALAAGYLIGALTVDYEHNGLVGLWALGLFAYGTAASGWYCARPPKTFRWRLAHLPTS